MKSLIPLAATLLIAGCHSAPSAAAPTVNPAKEALAAKLKAMPPEKRSEYMTQHPDEAAAAMPGLGMGKPHR
ncbi:hypothetical protein [Fimbriimonas ginsengisoli]|uniref:Lipoprotein n=1 Tax=Fimbriimonas ginsengisoli Gsoil 348 TaxID=661478 RepID=A0A068NVI5_FIMGI|nr:hypothetical protein [Fimbriimonas ginsengisoli]AIE85564.1 hypothetical protein OP10G_2196 [Fimbriimonas ginsengisoli Gsoil 348]